MDTSNFEQYRKSKYKDVRNIKVKNRLTERDAYPPPLQIWMRCLLVLNMRATPPVFLDRLLLAVPANLQFRRQFLSNQMYWKYL